VRLQVIADWAASRHIDRLPQSAAKPVFRLVGDHGRAPTAGPGLATGEEEVRRDARVETPFVLVRAWKATSSWLGVPQAEVSRGRSTSS
jgi:hypothetical protein